MQHLLLVGVALYYKICYNRIMEHFLEVADWLSDNRMACPSSATDKHLIRDVKDYVVDMTDENSAEVTSSMCHDIDELFDLFATNPDSFDERVQMALGSLAVIKRDHADEFDNPNRPAPAQRLRGLELILGVDN